MKPETREYLRANRSPDRVPGEFLDNLPNVDGTLEEVVEQANQEGWRRLQEKYCADAATALAQHDQEHGHYQDGAP